MQTCKNIITIKPSDILLIGLILVKRLESICQTDNSDKKKKLKKRLHEKIACIQIPQQGPHYNVRY